MYSKWSLGWILGLFIALVIIIGIIVLIIAFEKHVGPFGPTGNNGPTGQTGNNGPTGSPCGNATPMDQLCLTNGVVVSFQNQNSGGLMGICQGDIFNTNTYCVDAGNLNLVSTSPNVSNSTSWQILRSTDGQYIAFQNLSTGEYLSSENFWDICVPCDSSFSFACNFPVSTFQSTLDPGSTNTQPGNWFSINIVNLGSFVIQIIPLQSNTFGYLGTDPAEINSSSCGNMVVATYAATDTNSYWVLSYVS